MLCEYHNSWSDKGRFSTAEMKFTQIVFIYVLALVTDHHTFCDSLHWQIMWLLRSCDIIQVMWPTGSVIFIYFLCRSYDILVTVYCDTMHGMRNVSLRSTWHCARHVTSPISQVTPQLGHIKSCVSVMWHLTNHVTFYLGHVTYYKSCDILQRSSAIL